MLGRYADGRITDTVQGTASAEQCVAVSDTKSWCKNVSRHQSRRVRGTGKTAEAVRSADGGFDAQTTRTVLDFYRVQCLSPRVFFRFERCFLIFGRSLLPEPQQLHEGFNYLEGA